MRSQCCGSCSENYKLKTLDLDLGQDSTMSFKLKFLQKLN
ncbi:hypothetical protein FDUTEX481_10094 [Tolypothrix sp. PCC 7601]|nr:hypothetical protein FDUTEX481_10094 [Tolypothrix sp. PCC 7601]